MEVELLDSDFTIDFDDLKAMLEERGIAPGSPEWWAHWSEVGRWNDMLLGGPGATKTTTKKPEADGRA